MQLPEAFATSMRSLLGEDEFTQLQEALEQDAAVSYRPNPFHQAKALQTDTPVAWCKSGYYLNERPAFTFDPLFHAGAYYVQEASSMFVEQALRQCGNPRVVLDLCAAPGGKSTLLRSLLPDESLLVSNEPIHSRCQVLVENIIKWGHEACVVTQNMPKDFAPLKDVFDLIVVDAPCSGEGMFRKDNPALACWSQENVTQCAARQKEIVQDVWPALRDGGYMIYSTCTYNLEEDEKNVQWICQQFGATAEEISLSPSTPVMGNLLPEANFPVYHFFPHRTRGEGFFLALLRKGNKSQSNSISPSSIAKKTCSFGLTSAENMGRKKERRGETPCMADKISLHPNDLSFEKEHDIYYAVPNLHISLVKQLRKHLNVCHFGIPLYEEKGKKQIPHHALAMSRQLTVDAFPRVQVSLEEALQYLRGEAITIEAPRRYVLICYKNFPLGFANNLGNRANNLYPQNWRIRSSHLPENAPEICCRLSANEI